MNKVHQIAVAAILAASTVSVLAEPDLSECIGIDASYQRLLCYDRYAGRSTQAIVPPAQPPTGAPETAPPSTELQAARTGGAKKTPGNDTGTGTEADLDGFGLREATDRVTQPDYLTAKIVSVQSAPTGAQIVTLSNGQIWIENEKGRRPIESQQTVTIRRYRFHYKMELDSQPDVTVRRLQ